MRLRPLVTALVVWTASLSGSNAAETPSGLTLSSPPLRASANGGLSHPVYFGVMGEVARPGTYSARSVWTLAELIKKAGGITPHANKTVRIFRGGVLTEQVFLGSGEVPPLSPNDLVVVGAMNQAGPPVTAAGPGDESDATAISAVQLAFVNLIDRPVIVKMPGEQATLPRIVEVLGQPAECAASIRVFPPLGASPRDAESEEATSRPLESGTVLVFPAGSVHGDTLPPFPSPIADKSPPVMIAVAQSPQADSNSHEPLLPKPSPSDPKAGTAAPLKPTAAAPDVVPIAVDRLVVGQISRPPDITPHADGNLPRPSVASTGPSNQAENVPAVFTRPSRQRAPESHAARVVLVMAVMSAVAGLAMLLTFISIVQRWLESGRLPFARHPSSARTLSGSAASPVPPVSAALIRRPIRIDAGQPITRLSVDLAALERVTRSTTAR